METERQHEEDWTYVCSQMADTFLRYDWNTQILRLPIRDCLRLTFGNDQKLAWWYVRILLPFEDHRAFPPSRTIHRARCEVHCWAITPKRFPNPDGATNDITLDPPQLPGFPGKPNNPDVEDQLHDLLSNVDTLFTSLDLLLCPWLTRYKVPQVSSTSTLFKSFGE